MKLIIYTTKFVPQSISLNSDFSSASWSMAALFSGTDDINSHSGVTIAAADASFTPTAGTYANQSVTYNLLNYWYKIGLNVKFRFKLCNNWNLHRNKTL